MRTPTLETRNGSTNLMNLRRFGFAIAANRGASEPTGVGVRENPLLLKSDVDGIQKLRPPPLQCQADLGNELMKAL